jgi:hypothetical protein
VGQRSRIAPEEVGTPGAGPRVGGSARFIEHQGRRVLFIDFSGIRDRSTAFHAIDEVQALVATQPEGSLLTLTAVGGSVFDPEIVQALKALAVHNRPFVKAAAVVGLSGLQRVVYAAVMLCSGRDVPAFRDIAEAKDWLVAHAGDPG